MIAKGIALLDLHTSVDCQNALELIRANPDNYQGGRFHWDSGRKTSLKASAQEKVKSIEALRQRFLNDGL